MEDGSYAMQLEIDGTSAPHGWMTAVDNSIQAGDHVYSLTGVVREERRQTSGTLTIDLAPGVSGNKHIQGRFAMNVTGTIDDGRVSLIGTGPLGIIIELRATKER